MDIQKTFKDALDIVFLKEPAMHSVSADEDGLKPAIMMVGIGAIASALGLYLFPEVRGIVVYRLDFAALLSQAVSTFAMSIGLLYLTGYLAEKLFHSKLSMGSFVKIMGHAYILNILGLFPQISLIPLIWFFVVLWRVLTRVAKLGTANTIVLLVIEFFALICLGFVLVFSGLMTGVGVHM